MAKQAKMVPLLLVTTSWCIIAFSQIVALSALPLSKVTTLANTPTTTTTRLLTTSGLIESYNGNGSGSASRNVNGKKKKKKNQPSDHHIERGVIEESFSTVSAASTTSSTTTRTVVTTDRDVLIARAAKLRQSIVKQQAELVELERTIECCQQLQQQQQRQHQWQRQRQNNNEMISFTENNINNINNLDLAVMIDGTLRKFAASSRVLRRKLDRVKDRVGPKNARWDSVSDYIVHELEAGIRIVSGIVQRPEQIQQLIDPQTPTLVPHVPAILARLDKLELHVSPILERVLNNRQHLASIEPYLDEILERFDDIEPHLPWILDNIDALAPYTGLLLKHIDALLLFAEVDDIEKEVQALTTKNKKSKSSTATTTPINNATTPLSSSQEQATTENNNNNNNKKDYSLADQLLPYLEYYVSKLDVVGPHLVYLRPHVPLLLKHNRIARVSPHIDKLFARGYNNLGASANLDILLFWFGWSLRIPGLPRLFFALPFSPRLVTFLANRLPKKFARRGKGYCRNMECTIDENYGISWNKLESKSR